MASEFDIVVDEDNNCITVTAVHKDDPSVEAFGLLYLKNDGVVTPYETQRSQRIPMSVLTKIVKQLKRCVSDLEKRKLSEEWSF